MAIVTVLGAGMMGSALCVPLADAGHEVRLVGTHLDQEIVRSLQARGYHPKLALELPGAVRPFAVQELGQALAGAHLVGVGVSSAGVRWAGEQLRPHLRPDQRVVMISKGLEWDGDRLWLLPDLLAESWPAALRSVVQPTAVAGPCIAGELARRVETCVVLTGHDLSQLREVRQLLGTSYYHLWLSSDLTGVQVCAALKNAYAMGVGLAAGLHEKAGGLGGGVAMHNYEAAVFAQATLEIQCLATALGGRPTTLVGLAGTGDLNVTCNAGRTSRFGTLLGLGLSPSQAVERMGGSTLECLDILRVLNEALPVLAERGLLRVRKLPLLEHLMLVALHGAGVAMPFAQFFET
ncbi:2-dehydropantoate 2-reductase N-terminal domain-containing protein [Myxococcota bacterium]